MIGPFEKKIRLVVYCVAQESPMFTELKRENEEEKGGWLDFCTQLALVHSLLALYAKPLLCPFSGLQSGSLIQHRWPLKAQVRIHLLTAVLKNTTKIFIS